ncbi:MAG: glycosyltransferase family 2 protein [Simkania sp.]|nr:glycosyltransferase family 2 protein [Simkania sp.]MCP5491304.1 glycosyltransferase family 2 protein [Chlamydiales bacterium]
MINDEPYIIILNWNGKQDTLDCLESLTHVKAPHQIIVVDNGSTDDSVQAISTAFPLILLIETGENLGYAEGNNVGIREALKLGATHLLILNNDTTVEPDFLDAFLASDDAIQGAKPLLASDPTTLDHLGGIWEMKKGTFSLIGCREKASQWNERIPLDYVCGVALFAKAEVFKKIGLFEPRFFLFWEESDWCARAKRAGYQPYFCPNAKLNHKVSASFTGGKAHTTYFWWRNRLFWVKRNCSKKEKRSLYLRILIPEMSHILKLYPIKALQLALLKIVKPHIDLSEKEKRLRNYKAALTGMKDYFFGRFGNGPSWIFKSSVS